MKSNFQTKETETANYRVLRWEGYDLIGSCGWEDTYELALEKDSGYTAPDQIDGWRDEAELNKRSKPGKVRIEF